MWLDQLLESVRSFSFQSVLRGNIMSSPGAFGGSDTVNGMGGSRSNSPSTQMVSNRYLSTFYRKQREIKDYEITDLTETTLTIFEDYILAYFNTDGKIISIDSSVERSEEFERWINKVYDDLRIVQETKSHLRDIIYSGSWSFKLAWDPQNQKYVKFYLQNPHSVVAISKNSEVDSYLVVSRDGVIFQVKPNSIFKIDVNKITLINDINTKFYQVKKEDTLVKDEEMIGSTPLYFNITGKVKEYLLKEQILSLLSIKDLVQPLLLLVRLDKNTPPDEGNKLAHNVENMINKYSDISSILSSNFSINSLMDSLLHNIRVLPDYASSMGDMNNVDLSKVTNKIQDIEQSQDQKLDNILTALSIPKSLRDGQSTKWDAIKSNQRLNSKINKYTKGITHSISLNAVQLIEDKFGVKIPIEMVTCHLFNKTEVDFNVAITKSQIVGELTQGIQQILSASNQTLQEIQFIDKSEYLNYVSDQVKEIDPAAIKFINSDTISKALSQAEGAEGDDQNAGH